MHRGAWQGAYNLGVATPRALVHAGDKTSGDARSWYMISEDAKSWVCFDKDGMILYLVQCESLCRIPVFSPLTGCDRLVIRAKNTCECLDLECYWLSDVCHAALVVLHDALRALVDMWLVAMLIKDVSLAQLVDTDTESELEEAPSEAEESQSLGSRVPLMSVEFEASELSGTRTISSHSSASSDSTSPLSPDHPLTQASPTPTPTRVSFYYRTACITVRTQPTLLPGMSARIAKAAALSPSSFHKRYRSFYATPSPSSSLTLPIRKRYQGTSKLILDIETEDESSDSDVEGEGLEDEGPGLDNEGHVLDDEGHGLEDEGPGLRYGALRRRVLALGEGFVPSTFEVGQSFRFMPEQEGAERISVFRQTTLVTW
ncbi:hypothetical protein Tco_1369710 [Tanacetum coccineum]